VCTVVTMLIFTEQEMNEPFEYSMDQRKFIILVIIMIKMD